LIGAVSGYGIMSACGVGDLLAAHITGKDLPSYAPAFELARYENPEYQKELAGWQDTGQL
jgi:glycine/D-amino acid oxidase-like deaminating enzyme